MLKRGCHGRRVPDWFVDDHLDQRHDAVSVERRPARGELEQDDPEGPQVDRVRVRLFLHELGGHVQRSSLDGGEQAGVVGDGAREAEVCELDLLLGPDEDVLWLHVSVYDAVRVQYVQRLDELDGDLADLVLGQATVVLEHLEELSLRVLGDHAELARRLERVEHGDDVAVAQAPQDADLHGNTE